MGGGRLGRLGLLLQKQGMERFWLLGLGSAGSGLLGVGVGVGVDRVLLSLDRISYECFFWGPRPGVFVFALSRDSALKTQLQ